MLKNNDRKIKKLSLLVLDLPSFKLLTVTRFVTKSLWLTKKKEWEDFIIFVFVLDMIKINEKVADFDIFIN